VKNFSELMISKTGLHLSKSLRPNFHDILFFELNHVGHQGIDFSWKEKIQGIHLKI
jgi:hypothetical protein